MLVNVYIVVCFFFFQAEDGIRDLVRSRGLGDVYKRQVHPYRGQCLLTYHSKSNKVNFQFDFRFEYQTLDNLSLIHI